MDQHSTAFKPSLRLIDATMIVAGSMIGSGIFIVSTDIVRNVGSAGWLIVVWIIKWFNDRHGCCKLWRNEWYVSESRWPVCLFKRSL